MILDTWQSTPTKDTDFIVIPDGCMDLIVQLPKNAPPYWFISPLATHSNSVSIKGDVISQGFRLRPGSNIDKTKLLQSVCNQHLEIQDIYCRIEHSCYLNPGVSDALQCLALELNTVSETAKQLGVSERTLQRLLLKETGKPPSYWLSLARVRNCAKHVLGYPSLSQLAFDFGYSDQSHMSREFKRWLNVTPSKLLFDSVQYQQLQEAGYN
jgi:AraC-like DNA-binding protein